MKATARLVDDYKAKVKFYAKASRVLGFCFEPELPHFGHVSFSSYAEMNAWKRKYLLSLARRGGCKWKKL